MLRQKHDAVIHETSSWLMNVHLSLSNLPSLDVQSKQSRFRRNGSDLERHARWQNMSFHRIPFRMAMSGEVFTVAISLWITSRSGCFNQRVEGSDVSMDVRRTTVQSTTQYVALWLRAFTEIWDGEYRWSTDLVRFWAKVTSRNGLSKSGPHAHSSTNNPEMRWQPNITEIWYLESLPGLEFIV